MRSFNARVLDAGGGQVTLIVDRDIYAYPHDGESVFVTADPLLTDEEHAVLDQIGGLCHPLRHVIGDGPQAVHDWHELVPHIHALQRAVLKNAAARAYPDLYRLLGSTIPEGDALDAEP